MTLDHSPPGHDGPGGSRPGTGTGAGSIPVRRINLSTLMRLVHTRGPISRAELTRITGLNRSTVGVLLADLSRRGRIRTGAPLAARAVGRPSPLIHPAPHLVAITAYPDADALDLAVVGLAGTVHTRARRTVPSAPTPEQTVALLAQMIAELQPELAARTVLGIGMAVPGLVRNRDGFVHLAPHLPWRDVPIAQMVQQATGLPTFVGNDATVGTGAEATFGAGQRAGSLVYLHGGSGGIGSGVHLPGPGHLAGQVQAHRSPHNDGHHGIDDGGAYLPELGHLLVNSSGRRCHCGAIGCLETEVNLQRLCTAVGADADAAAGDSALLARAVREHGGAEHPEVRRQVGFLATGIRNAVNAFAPNVVLLGGFLGTLLELAPDHLTAAVREQLMPPLAAVVLRRGSLGSARIHIGAAEAVFEPLLRDPLADQMP